MIRTMLSATSYKNDVFYESKIWKLLIKYYRFEWKKWCCYEFGCHLTNTCIDEKTWIQMICDVKCMGPNFEVLGGKNQNYFEL